MEIELEGTGLEEQLDKAIMASLTEDVQEQVLQSMVDAVTSKREVDKRYGGSEEKESVLHESLVRALERYTNTWAQEFVEENAEFREAIDEALNTAARELLDDEDVLNRVVKDAVAESIANLSVQREGEY